MRNRVLLAYVIADGLFVITGALMLGFSVIVKNLEYETPTEGIQAARDLLYQRFPLNAGIVNSALIFLTFLATIPGITTPTRGWLKLSAWMTTISGVFSLIIGLYIWVRTLQTKSAFSAIWNAQKAEVQDLMEISFNCCGYFNSSSPAFVTNDVCPSPAAAALVWGCAAPISSYANIIADEVFTTVFSFTGVDFALILATACLLKERKERERFRYIDEKSGKFSSF